MKHRSASTSELVRLQHPIIQPHFSRQQAAELIARTGRLLASQLLKSVSACKTPTPSGPGLVAMRQALCSDKGLDLCNTTSQFSSIETRMRQLNLSAQYPLFAFPSVEVPLLDRSRPPQKYSVPVPLGLAKLVLADVYRQKYGINIQPVVLPKVLAGNRNESWPEWVERALGPTDSPVGRTVGVVLQAGNNPCYVAHPMKHEDHVEPLVIHAHQGRLEVVNLDSLGEGGFNFIRLLGALRKAGYSVQAVCVRTCRQADIRSCHTDAMQVLKDVLVQFKQSGGVSMFWFLNIETPGTADADELTLFSLPSNFQKTTQRSAALRDDSYRADELLDPARYCLHANGKSLTIGQYRAKYHLPFDCRSRSFAVRQGRPVNQFLTVKAYYNAQRVLDCIKARGQLRSGELPCGSVCPVGWFNLINWPACAWLHIRLLKNSRPVH